MKETQAVEIERLCMDSEDQHEMRQVRNEIKRVCEDKNQRQRLLCYVQNSASAHSNRHLKSNK